MMSPCSTPDRIMRGPDEEPGGKPGDLREKELQRVAGGVGKTLLIFKVPFAITPVGSADIGYDGSAAGRPMPELAVQSLLVTPILSVLDVCCRGSVPSPSAEERATATQLVFPYRGAYVRHLGAD